MLLWGNSITRSRWEVQRGRQSLPGQVKVTALLPVCGNVDLGDLEVKLSGAAHWDAITSCGKVQQLFLQLQGEGKHHVPEAPGGGRAPVSH